MKKNNDEEKYNFFDVLLNTSINCTASELCAYAKRSERKSLNQIKNTKWYKNRFKLIRKKKPPIKGYTYIKRNCSDSSYCFRSNMKKCNFCLLESEPYYSIDEFIKISTKKNPDIDILSDINGTKVPILCKCKNCGYTYEKMPRDLLSPTSCQMCISSRGKQVIADMLTKYAIKFEKEKTFDELKDNTNLKFDFYLPEYNAVIEHDGLQHFKPVLFFGSPIGSDSKLQFEKLQHHDKMKNEYCFNHNIPLLRIRYDEKNIEKKIKTFLICQLHIYGKFKR